MLKFHTPIQYIPDHFDAVQISRNLNYPLWHLEDVLLPLFHRNYTRDSLHDTIRSANHIWCVYEDGACLGCSLMTDIGSDRGLYMMLFGIRQSAQGRGMGKRLLEEIILWSRRRGYRFIYLHTEHDNRRAIRMYEKAGFRPELHRSSFDEQLPQYGWDAVPMILFL